jgi:dCMP deaminase
MTTKAREVLPWRDYWMNEAKGVATRSKDPSSQVGCVLVHNNERLGSGYNGFIAKCDESKMSWDRPMKYHLVIHAEMNAVMRALTRKPGELTLLPEGTKAYVTDGPCDNCLKHMLQTGVREIYYNTPKIMHERGTVEQKQAIAMLIEGTGAIVKNFNTDEDYVTDLNKPIP